MKTPREIINGYYPATRYLTNEELSLKHDTWIKMIEEAQKDAYNQALIDAAENAEAYLDHNDIPRVGKQTILRLKK